MPFPLTEEQAYAVDTLHVNCIVPAGAGSGKTRVLVERYVKIIEESQHIPHILEKIVAITFTEKAAREMKERIRKEMVERQDHAKVNQNWQQAELWQENIQRLERATISTIHSFCAKILREFPIEAKIDPEFQVLDQTQMRWLLLDVVEKELKKQLEEERTKGISALYQWVIASGFHRAVRQIVKVYEQVKNSGYSLQEVRKLTEEQFKKSPYEWLIGFDEVIDAGDALYHANAQDGNKNFKTFQSQWPDLKETLIKAKNQGNDLEHVIETLVKLTSGNLGKGEVKEQRGLVNQLAKDLLDQLAGVEHLEWEKVVLESFYPLLEQIEKKINQEKERLNGLDFDDLQLRVVQLLRENQEVRKSIQNRYSYFLLDEFQDNNQIQKMLISLLLKDERGIIEPGRLFVVGDPKQSIYRFRGADVYVFKEMEKEIIEMNGRVAPLQFNFRSHPDIIQFVNHFFQKIMSTDPNSPNYYKDAIAKGNVECQENPIEFIPIYHDREDEESAREKEAEAIALRIEQLLKRGVQPGEITILFRAMLDIKTYEQAMSKRRIPYYVMGGRGFYQKQEIHDLIHVLKYIFDPSNKIALAGILRSPMVGIQDDTLYWVMSRLSSQPVHHLSLSLDDLEENEKKKLEHFFSWLNQVQNKVSRIKVSELLRFFLELTYYKAILLSLPQGRQAVANIDKLIRFAENFPGDNPYSIDEFLMRFDRLVEDEDQETEAAIESEMGNTVKLMTIHQSKGLEFPFVFVPDLARKPISEDSLIRFDSDFGLTCKVPIEEEGFAESIRYHVSREKEKKLDREESARILYVAMTRAEKKLFLSGKVEEAKNKEDLKDVLKESTWIKWLDAVLRMENISLQDRQWPYVLKNGEIAKIQVMIEHLLEKSLEKKQDLEEKQDIDQVPHEELEQVEWPEDQEVFIDYTKSLALSPADNRYSISSIKRYQQCPRYYYFTDRLSLFHIVDWITDQDQEYLLEEDIENEQEEEFQPLSLSPSLKGSIVHYVFEQLTLFPERVNDWQQITETGLINQGYELSLVNQEEWKSFLIQVNQYVSDFRESPYFATKKENIWTEFDVTLSLKNGQVNGTIDRLEFHSDGTFTIVDYKTDQKMDVEQYRSQILTYALAVWKQFNRIPKEGKLYYIRHNQTEIIPIDVAMLENWEAKLEKILEKLNHSTVIEDFPKNNQHCYFCSYRNLCQGVTL
ncbi:UvrD-helicase domain-containing protein [Tepidibacillus fermentans]|uniref:DNA 3'-5' helicase n=1 Tax=Tepidibacillus fermentans TaxID=1281767 RepID=A0A4R3KNH6_9BACI|nr:UvrD-helicase domain-containing protein [Tepidibacillus fermentans]TCS84578.1 ATP-dependent exoDNAse (exonuclease V) beta subunit [Tepidibacillus fermentans]